MQVALLRPPGINKYKIAKRVSEEYSIPIISLKDLLLQEVNSGSELGFDIKKQVDNSKPVSNDNIISIMKKTFEAESFSEGFLLDGLPCNDIQAQALDKILTKKELKLQGVVFLYLDYDRLMEFLTGHLTCRDCHANFNIYFSPPYMHKICDDCGGKLYQRTDDREETISRRIREFETYLLSLEKYYSKDLLKVVVSGIDVDEIYAKTKKSFHSLKKNPT